MIEFFKKHRKKIIALILAITSGGGVTIGLTSDGISIQLEKASDVNGDNLSIENDSLEFKK